MSGKIYFDKEELLLKAEQAIGRRIGDFDINERFSKNKGKGNIGQIMEEGFFGYSVNSKREADFNNLGIELKVTGYKRVKNGKEISAKERLVITMINYFSDYDVSFQDSILYHKLNQMLLLLYEYEIDKNECDFTISKFFFYEFEGIDDLDKEIIIDDWNTIISKIKAGKADELSESDTFYLSACTKGANSDSITLQPFSPNPAKTRAFALKNSYMTYLFREKLFKDLAPSEHFIKNKEMLVKSTLEKLIYKCFEKFRNKTLTDIDKIVQSPVSRIGNKSYISNYVARMMKISDSTINNIEEFKKANIKIKTIRVKRNGSIKESMSFPAFDFVELSKETWNDSEIKDQFASTKFLFVVFDEIDDSKFEYKFRGVKLWTMPESDLDNYVKKVWMTTHDILNGTLNVEIRNNSLYNNFPGSKINPVSHIRPHGKNSYDTVPLPKSCIINITSSDGSKDISTFLNKHVYTKQCFWLNNSYIFNIVSKI